MIVTFPNDSTTLTLSELEALQGRSFTADDIIVIPSGKTLTLDQPATLGGLVVQGQFTVDDSADYELASEWVAVIDGGQFQVGSEQNPHEHEFTLTLTGDDPDQDVNITEILMEAGVPMSGMGGRDMVLENQDAFLMVMGEGSRLDLHGADASKTSWTQLDGTAQAGATSFTLTEATGWRPGDKIAIASTDFDLNQAEELTVTSVSDDGRTISFEPPLDYMHYGQADRYDDPDGDVHVLDMRAEVTLLSRNVKIQGDVDYDPSKPLNEQDDQYGGHTMVMNGGEMYISGAEFAFMGQAGILGKYPVHWHESGDVSGQYVRDSSIHHSFNKGVTIHDTHNAEVTDNVVYETISHNYYFEDGTETGSVLTDNLGMNAREPGRFGEIRGANDDNPSNFYTPNGDNTWIGNHAAGSEDKNFYFSLGGGEGRNFGTFVDNSAHSAEGRSFYLNHGGLIQDGNPRGDAEQPQRVDPWSVEGLTVYKSDGVYVRGVEGTFTDSSFAEMSSNARFRLNQTIEDSLIVGRSDNIGNPQTSEEIAAGRSLPDGDGKFQGFQLYDGPGGVSNVMFDGFEGDDVAIDLSNAIHKTSSFFVKGVTWGENVDEAAKFEIGGGGNAIGVDNWARGLVDVDGSVTGVPGSMIYQYSSDRDGSRFFNAGENYEVIEEWGAIVTYGQSSGTLRIDNGGTAESNTGNNHGGPADELSVTRSDGEYGTSLRKQIPVFSEYTYELDYRSIDDQFRLYLHDMDWGQSVIFNLGPVPATSSFTVDDPYSDASWAAREVSSMAMLEASPDTAVYRDADGQVHIKLVGEMAHGYLWPQPGESYNDALHSGVTVLVDTQADLDLDTLEFNDPGPGDVLPPPPYAEGQGPDAPQPEPVGPPEVEPVEPEPTGETVMAFVEQDGIVLIEAESHPDLPEGWVKRGDYDEAAAPDLGALGGKNNFVMWQGADQSDAPGDAVLSYYVVIETPGRYDFELRDQPAFDNPEKGGDTWVKIDGAKFYGLQSDSGSSLYPEGAAPGSYPADAEPLPEADGEGGWMRYQSTNRSTHWGSGGHVNDTGSRDDRHDIVVEFDEPGVYEIQLSGATPSSHAIGSFALVNREIVTEFSLQGEESAQREVSLGQTAPTDPGEPIDPAPTDPGEPVNPAPTNPDEPIDITPPGPGETPTFHRVIGDALDNLLKGTTGADWMDGDAGRDILRGEAGNDEAYGGAGADIIRGGAGNDMVYGQDGDDIVVSGDRGDDMVYGGAGNDVLRGGADNDMVYGDEGNDRLVGDRGDDMLYGGAGDDVLIGHLGDDYLIGGDGFDRLVGGEGADIFKVEGAQGMELIADFQQGVDKIDLSFYEIGSFDQLKMSAANAGGVKIDLSDQGGESVIVRNVELEDLTAEDFVI